MTFHHLIRSKGVQVSWQEIDRRSGGSVVMQALNRTQVLSRKAKLSIYQALYFLILTYIHELRAVTERRAEGLNLRDQISVGHLIRMALGLLPLRGAPGTSIWAKASG